MTQPIQSVQIYYEHPFGAEREVLREFFSFVGCLVKTTMMPVETMLEKHKSLANPESEQITHLFLTDRPPKGIALSKNEMWCSFRISKRELTINRKAITLGGGKDSTWIKLSDAQLRMLFMTGDGKEKGGRSPNNEQSAAIERAANRFNDMERRGLLDGNIHCFCVTLYGMEYYRSKTADK